MTNIHDIDTCINILRDEGCDVRQIKNKTDITNNNGIITYQKHSKFKPFNDVFVMFIVALFFSGLLSLVFAELGIIWSIIAFFFITCLLSPLTFLLDDGWDNIIKYKIPYLGMLFIALIIVIMLSYNIHIKHLEYDLSFSWNRNNTELVQKYEYLKNLPHWLFHIK
jgi:hypothetical protein